MGCCGSTGARGSKAQDFEKLVESGNPLAKAMKEHWDAFMKEQKYKKQGNMDTYDHLFKQRQKKVRVVSTLEEAEKANLTRQVVDEVANKFLAYAMQNIASTPKWSGNVQFTTNGAKGRDSQMKVTAQVQYEDSNSRKCTEPYHVIYEFYVA